MPTTTVVKHPDGTSIEVSTEQVDQAPAGGKLVVAYWTIRGLGAPLRMMCEYAGVEYEARSHDCAKKEGGGFDMTEWFVDNKPGLKEKNALINLPYVLDGDKVITQTNACIFYLGQKLGLFGETEDESMAVMQCLCQVMDLRNAMVALVYGGNFDEGSEEPANQLKSANEHYTKLEGVLKLAGTTYTAGATPTAADFHIWEMIDQHELLAAHIKAASPLAEFPLLSKLYADMRALPQLAAYFAGPLYKLPLNNKMAKFGAGGVVRGVEV